MYTIILDSVWKTRGKTEGRKLQRATCQVGEKTYTSQGDGWNLAIVCEQMSNDGLSGPVEVIRGQTVVFKPSTVDSLSKRWATTGAKKPEWLVQHKT